LRRSLILSLLCAASAAAAPLATRTIRVSVRPVGEPEKILKPADFKVRVNGKPVPVVSEKSPRDGQMIIIVLDLAGDLTDAQAAKDAVVAELSQLPASTLVALIRAQDGPAVLVDPTTNRSSIIDAIQSSAVAGKAGLLDSLIAIELLADSISRAANVRVATLYVTDSNVTNYREDFSNPVINSSDSHDLSRRFPGALIGEKMDKLEGEISGRETPLYIAHLRYSGSTLSAAYQSGLKRLAEVTGGWSDFCASTAEIPDSVHQGFAAMASGYTLTVGLPPKVSPALQIHIESPEQALVYRSRLVLSQKGKR
jgi:hypothetical protein